MSEQSKVVRTPSNEDGLIFVDALWELAQSYRRDPLQGRFFAALKDKRLLGARDPVRNRVLFPPRGFAEESYAELDQLVPVGPGGVIRTITRMPGGGVPRSKPKDAETPAEQPKPRPAYLVAFVQLDGADTAAAGHLRGTRGDVTNPASLIGVRCRTVFKPEPAGDWGDYWFELEG